VAARDLTLRIEGASALLYRRHARAYQRCDAAQAFLLVASVEAHWRAALATLGGRIGQQRAEDALSALNTLGAFNDMGRFDGRVLELPSVSGAYCAPLVAHLGVTSACNFSCAHCYSSSGKRDPDELSTAEIEALITELAAIGCCKLVLGGGEPLLRDDLAAVVRHADALGVDAFVHTNGSLLTHEVLQELAACPPAGLSVSLDGPDAASNDAIRGPRAFARTQAGLALLRKHYPPGFTVSATVMPRNADTVAAMVDVAAHAGARLLLVRPSYPAGEALHDDTLVCDRETFVRVADAVRQRAAAIGMAVDVHHPDECGTPGFAGFGCVAARLVLGITPRGEVTPCLNLPTRFVSGSLRELPLIELWRAGTSFVALRDLVPNAKCAVCSTYETCRGGCRVRALQARHDPNDCDTWCREASSGCEAALPVPAERGHVTQTSME